MSIDCCDFDRCNQGRNCPVRATYEANRDVFSVQMRDGGEQVVDGLPVVMFSTTRQRLGDLFLDVVCLGTLLLSVVWWIANALLVAIAFAALFFATGLYRIF